MGSRQKRDRNALPLTQSKWELSNEMQPSDYLSDNYTVVDFETTNKDSGDPRNADNSLILSVYGRTEYDHSWGGEYRQSDLVRQCEEAAFFVAHNAKFEYGWLRRCGLDLTKTLCFDTMIAEYVILGNRKKPLDLDSVCARYGLPTKNNLIKRLLKGGVCPSDMPRPWLYRYGYTDVAITEALFRKQLKILVEKGLLEVFFTRCMLTPVLSDLEFSGMTLDATRVEEKYDEYVREYATVEAELEAAFGNGINWNSSDQVAELLYETLGFAELTKKGKPLRNKASKRWPEGKPKTDADTLLSLKATNKNQKHFIELKRRQSKLSKAISTYLSLFKEACDESGGNLRGNFNQCITGTHRLSSSKPNFQNFDRNFKPLFTARNGGWKIGEADYAQLEFRVAAFLGGDSKAIDDIREGFDVHQFTADIIGCDRQSAKAHTFKPLFGGTSGTRDEVRYYTAFKEKYSSIADTQDRWVSDTLLTKEQTLASGLILYHPYLKLSGNSYVEGNTKVRNYPIQSLATAEIVPIGVRKLWELLKEHNCQSFIVNTIHDSVIMEIHPDEEELVEQLVVESFTSYTLWYLKEYYNIDFNVPLVADFTLSDFWGEK